MDIIEDPIFKTKYLKHKLRVKLWESEFMEKYGLKPNKNDIKAADTMTREAYKMYWKLKTKALENTLTEITFCEEFEKNNLTNISESVLHSTSPIHENQNKVSGSDSIIVNNEPVECNNLHEIDISTSTEDKTNPNKTFNESFNEDQKPLKKNKNVCISKSSFQLQKKMFKTFSFSKRNPRKSASESKLLNKTDKTLDAHSNKDIDDEQSKTNDYCINNIPDSSFGTNFKIIQTERKASCQSTNTIQHLIEKYSTTYNRDLNQSWLGRCIEDNNSESNILESHGLSKINNFETESSKHFNLSTENLSVEKSFYNSEDNEDYICNSDCEEELKKKRVRNYNKIINDNDVQLSKKLCKGNSLNTSLSTNIDNRFPVDVNKTNLSQAFENTLNCDSVNNSASTCKLKEQSYSTLIQQTNNLVENDNISTSKSVGTETDTICGNYNNSKYDEAKEVKQRIACEVKEADNSICFVQKPQKVAEKNYFDKNQYKIQNEMKYCIDQPSLNVSSMSDNVVKDCSQILESSSSIIPKSNIPLKTESTRTEKFKQQLTAGKLNENFVKLNLKKKVFSRNKKSFNFSKYKKTQWKQRKKELNSNDNTGKLRDSNDLSCFKCGETGHFARQCKKVQENSLLELDGNEDCFPTLQEVEEIAKMNANKTKCEGSVIQTRNISFTAEQSESIHEENVNMHNFNNNATSNVSDVSENYMELQLSSEIPKIDPVYRLNENGSIKDTPLEVLAALKQFGYNEFREGQEKAIMRILSGKSTLLSLATGSGKSLCYQLPAYMYAKKSACITLVVSPLVSLMDDQISKIPDFLPAACLHTNQSAKSRSKAINDLKEGKLSILLVSPEAIVMGEKLNLKDIFCKLPPIAFACIDEVHCISQWSHNFRPSYLMVCNILKKKFGVKLFLGLTATASKTSTMNIINLLGIEDGVSGVISQRSLPLNLFLTVSQDENREDALIQLLRSPKFIDCDSIIIYCTRREECDKIAKFLRIYLQESETKKKPLRKNSTISTIAEAYHAGLTPHRRKMVQTAFMTSKIRIIVATVAFGMGINKSNIRSVIHFNMPASFESYVQEVGRAGRDGLPAYCHLFLSPKENYDEYELRRHINSDGIDRHTIRRLLQKIFIPCNCVDSNKDNNHCPGHEVVFSVEETIKLLDISEEMIVTQLCYLELHPKQYIEQLSSIYMNAKVSSHSGPVALKLAAQSSPPLAKAITLSLKNGSYHEGSSTLEFSVVDVAAAIGWNSGYVKSHLKNLEWMRVNGELKKSAISVQFNTLGFRVKAPGNLSHDELDEALESLSHQSQMHASLRFQQLKLISTELRNYSLPSVKDCLDLSKKADLNSEGLKNTICNYFEQDDPLSNVHTPTSIVNVENETQIIADIRSLISIYQDNNFTGRSVARIFHGIQSPNYPALIWARCRFWRAHLANDFDAICQLATREILKMK